MSENNQAVIATLLLQRDMFGDDLFTPVLESEQYSSVQEIISTVQEPEAVYNSAPTAAEINITHDISKLEEYNASICNCTICPLGATRKKFVFGVGNPHAAIMLVG